MMLPAALTIAILLPAADATVVELTQTPCQFLRVEKDQKLTAKTAAECKDINRSTLAARKKGFVPLKLAAGPHVFRVKNSNVPYVLGFWLRGEGEAEKTLPGVGGGGIRTGTSKDYRVDLKPGRYLFSCPLNPTPDYPIIVE